MPKAFNYPDPNGATTIGASLQIVRVNATANGVNIAYNPNNGDTSLETTMAAALSPAARANLAAVIAELDAFYKLQKGYV